MVIEGENVLTFFLLKAKVTTRGEGVNSTVSPNAMLRYFLPVLFYRMFS